MEKSVKMPNDIINNIRTHLEYQKLMGVEEMPCHHPGVPASRRSDAQTPRRPDAQTPVRHHDSQSASQLIAIRADMGDCTRCKLCKGKRNLVFGVGNPNADLMFIGEAPGQDEDIQGEPFVGRAGQLLTKIINAMGYKREDVYITNIVKCRPPNNRNPEPDEIEACIPFLYRQINVIKPKIIVALGAVAAKAILNTEVPISKLRGKFIEWRTPDFSDLVIKVMPTYHPAFLLRNPNMKRPVWEDMQKVMQGLV